MRTGLRHKIKYCLEYMLKLVINGPPFAATFLAVQTIVSRTTSTQQWEEVWGK